jgi:TRAP-type C4-dicarboxylate transport system permease large subunit
MGDLADPVFFFLIIGFFLHSAAAIIMVVPLIAAAGIGPVHFGLVVTLNLKLVNKHHLLPAS